MKILHKYSLQLLTLGFMVACKTAPKPNATVAATATSAPSETAKTPAFDPIKDYRAAREKQNDLIHSNIEVSFNWNKAQLNGKAMITLKPHFYETDSLILDAKGMDISRVEYVSDDSFQPMNYTYDSTQLRIKLPFRHNGGQKYTVLIAYTAKPNELKVKGSNAITDAKGLYFINPENKPGKPQQIWTQGETEANSAWFPTIDAPNQKMTTELSITVDTAFVTLSNGLLIKQIQNKDNTRTDVWKQTLPHAPYLTMMAIGKYAVIKDTWRKKEVNYYVEPEYAPHAKAIFGNTPEMIEFFSNALGVAYPWDKYSQVVVRDYVSGAMENTGAVIFGDFAQQTTRQLIDGDNESVISHELFHHWFGDLVTCESWSNLSLNESFATYGEYLWNEYKYGRKAADMDFAQTLTGYLRQAQQSPHRNLIRFYYKDKEDMFDGISYAKGGRILHMLRKFVGDKAFFESLKLYLTRYQFQAAEAHQLRLCFEEVTGKDLNWFFNQWYYNAGHPKLNITYGWNDSTKMASVTIEQTQQKEDNVPEVFQMPLAVDLYYGYTNERRQIWVNERKQTFMFALPIKPTLINVDAEKMLVCTKTDNKDTEAMVKQFRSAPLYLDKIEALEYFKKKNIPESRTIYLQALDEDFWGIREYALKNIKKENINEDIELIQKIKFLAQNDPKSNVRAVAIRILSDLTDKVYLPLFNERLQADSSYFVGNSALAGIAKIDSVQALQWADKLKSDMNYTAEIMNVYTKFNVPNKADFMEETYAKMQGFDKVNVLNNYAEYLTHFTENEVNRGITFYSNVAKTAEPWWMRMIAYQGMDKFIAFYDKQQKNLETQRSALPKNDVQIETLNGKIVLLKNKIDAINNLKTEIRAAETNDQLKDIYKNDK